MVVGLALRFDRLHDRGDLVVRGETTLNAHRLGILRLRQQEVTVADEALCTGGIQDYAAVQARCHVERHAVRDVRLDKARDHVGRGALRGNDEVDAGRAGELRYARDGELHLLPHVHHEVCQLVYDDNDVGKRSLGLAIALGIVGPVVSIAGVNLIAFDFAFHDLFVKRSDIPHANLREQFQAPLHLGDTPRERTRRLLRLGHHGNVQVRNTVVGSKLHAFRVNHDETNLGRRRPHEH